MGLSLRNIKKKIVDVFDANTQADQQRRVAAGQPRMYQPPGQPRGVPTNSQWQPRGLGLSDVPSILSKVATPTNLARLNPNTYTSLLANEAYKKLGFNQPKASDLIKKGQDLNKRYSIADKVALLNPATAPSEIAQSLYKKAGLNTATPTDVVKGVTNNKVVKFANNNLIQPVANTLKVPFAAGSAAGAVTTSKVIDSLNGKAPLPVSVQNYVDKSKSALSSDYNKSMLPSIVQPANKAANFFNPTTQVANRMTEKKLDEVTKQVKTNFSNLPATQTPYRNFGDQLAAGAKQEKDANSQKLFGYNSDAPLSTKLKIAGANTALTGLNAAQFAVGGGTAKAAEQGAIKTLGLDLAKAGGINTAATGLSDVANGDFNAKNLPAAFVKGVALQAPFALAGLSGKTQPINDAGSLNLSLGKTKQPQSPTPVKLRPNEAGTPEAQATAKPQVRLKNSELPKDNPLYISPKQEAALNANVAETAKYKGDPLPINKPTVKAKGAPEGVGTIPLEQLGPPKIAEARTVEGKVMKDPTVKKVFDNLSKADRISKTEQGLTATAIEQAAKKHGIDTADLNVWDRLQTGKPKNVAERRFFKDVKAETDRIFKLQQQVDPSIVYRENYLPGKYAQQGTPAYDDAIQQLKSVTGSEKAKSFDTYRQAKDIGGLDPKYKTLQETLASNAGEAQKALFTKQAVDAGLADGVFDTKPLNRNWKQVEGMYTSDGSPVYASKGVADRINNAMQPPSDFVGKSIEKAAKVSGGLQQIALTGGWPNSWVNAFGISQEFFQGMGYGRPGIITDMAHSASRDLTQQRFNAPTSVAKGLSTPEFVRQAEAKGANIGQITSDASTMNEGFGRRALNKASGEQATFQQLMPNIKLSILEDTYKKFVGEMGHDQALQVAADTVNKATGFIDEIGKGRSTNVRNLKTATLFAPQYREAVIGQLNNAVKAWLPKNAADPSFRYGKRFTAGLVTTAGMYDAINYKLNGHHMWDNRNGQELSLQIPTGEKDDKGNQPVINIPLFPSILTIPRAVVNGTIAAIRGDGKAVVKEGSKVLATPLQVGGQIISNRDYFDRPIFNDAATAADQGINPDNAAQAAGKIGIYAAKQLLPGIGRAGLDKLGVGRDKPASWGEFAAAATEAPVRFGKQLNPTTEAYFNDRDQVYGKLNKNDKAAWDAIHPPIKKNVNGEYITDKTVWSGATRAANYLNSPNVLAAENEMAARAKARGEKVDPLFGDLKGQQQLIALTIDTLPPKDPNKTILKEQNPWYDQYYKNRQAFFDSLPPGDPNKPKGPIAYPEPSGQVASLQDAYYQLTDSKARAQMMENNPELADQFAKEEQYARAVRAAKNLPQYDRYPQATPQVQRLIDEYSALPSKESGGKSRIRSAWIKSHPKEWALMSDQFSKQAQYNLQQDASLASFEGRDLTEKGIKAITSLAKDLGMSTGGGYGGGYGGGSGSSSSNPYQYAVSLKAGKVSLKGKAAQPKKSKGTSKRYTVAKPKVTSKKSRV